MSFLLSSALPPIDTEIAKEKLIRLLRAWAARTYITELPYHERSVDNAAVIVLKVLVEHKCTMDWAWLRIRRAIGTLDASLIYLYPELNYVKITREYFRRAHARTLRRMVGRRFAVRAFQSMVTTMDMQDQLQEYVGFQAGLIRRQAQVFQAASSKFSYAFSVLIGWLALLVFGHAVLVLLELLGRRYPADVTRVLGTQLTAFAASTVPMFDAQLTSLMLVLELYLVFRLRALRSWLRAKDHRPHTSTKAL
jgi:ubiquinone biosynthesis protein